MGASTIEKCLTDLQLLVWVLQILVWVIGITIVPIFTWGVFIMRGLRSIKQDTAKLEDPERYGFGTRNTNRVIEANTRAVKALTHYMVWLGLKTSRISSQLW